MKNNKLFNIVTLVVSAVLLSYFDSMFFHYGVAFIASSNPKIYPYVLSIILVSISLIATIVASLNFIYVDPLKPRNQLILTIISSIITVISIILFILSARIHFTNMKYHIDSLSVTIGCLVSYVFIIILHTISYSDIIKKKYDKYEFERPLSILTRFKKICLVILLLYFGYGLMSLNIGLWIIKNIEVYPFGYITLLYLFLMMMLNLIYFIIIELKNNKKMRIISVITNSLGILLFILAEIINFSFMPYISKPFCPIDFTANIIVLPTLIIIELLSMIIYSIIGMIKNKKS